MERYTLKKCSAECSSNSSYYLGHILRRKGPDEPRNKTNENGGQVQKRRDN